MTTYRGRLQDVSTIRARVTQPDAGATESIEPEISSLERRLADAIFFLRQDEDALVAYLQGLAPLARPTAAIVVLRQTGAQRGVELCARAFGPEIFGAMRPSVTAAELQPWSDASAWDRFDFARARGVRDVLLGLARIDRMPDAAELSEIFGGLPANVALSTISLLRRTPLLAVLEQRIGGVSGRIGPRSSRADGATQGEGQPTAPLAQAAERRAVTLMRREAAFGGRADPDHPAVEAALRRIGQGEPLAESLRLEMERRLRAPLDRVRIHVDPVADRAARAIGARAFTAGEDIFFASGAFAPDTPSGLQLVAHELAHVVQGYQGRVPSGGSARRLSSPGEALEQEAEARGGEAVSNEAPRGEAVARGSIPGARPHDPGRPATLYRSSDKDGEPSWWSEVGDWILGVLAGDFEEDPSISQIIVRTLLTLIPYVDQAGDVEDLIAALYKLIWQERYDEFDPWFGLVVTLLGLIPELGSALKGVIKVIFKGAKNVDLGALLKLLERLGLKQQLDVILKQLDDLLARLPELGKQLADKARTLLRDLAGKTDELIAKLRRVPKIIEAVIAEKLGRLIARLERFSQAARAALQAVEKQVDEALARLRQQLGHVKEALSLARRIGFADATRLFRAVDPGDLAKLGKLDDATLRKLVKLEDAALSKISKLDDAALAVVARQDEWALRMLGDNLSTAEIQRLAGRFPDPERMRELLAPMKGKPPESVREMLQSAERTDAVRQGSPGLPASRNLASASIHIDGAAGSHLTGISGRTIEGTTGLPAQRRFRTFPVPAGHDRQFDSEVKIFETLAEQLDPRRVVKPGAPSPVRGRITLFSERPPCPSCAGVIEQFKQMFPNIDITVSYDTTRFLADGTPR